MSIGLSIVCYLLFFLLNGVYLLSNEDKLIQQDISNQGKAKCLARRGPGRFQLKVSNKIVEFDVYNYSWIANIKIVRKDTMNRSFRNLFLLFILIQSTYSNNNPSPHLFCAETDNINDCAALSEIYNSISYAENRSRLPWSNASKICTRQFIQCNSANRVNVIDLHNLGLTGTIPPQIGLLHHLNKLYLYANEINGILPGQLCGLTSLTDLDVSENLLSGTLPRDLGNLTSLTYLGFSYNKITGTIPASINNLVNLRTLKGDYNQIQGRIPEIDGLTALMYFVLSYNQLVGPIPSSIGSMIHLYDCELHNNYLTSIPKEISKLKELTSLSVGFNSMSGSIPSFENMTSLVGLFLENNQFNSTIPDTLSTLINLKQLELDHNLLTGAIPKSLNTMSGLETLHLNNNHLSGTITNGFGSNFTSMVSLFLNDNLLTGAIPLSLEKYACWLNANSTRTSIQCKMGNNNFTCGGNMDNCRCVVERCDL